MRDMTNIDTITGFQSTGGRSPFPESPEATMTEPTIQMSVHEVTRHINTAAHEGFVQYAHGTDNREPEQIAVSWARHTTVGPWNEAAAEAALEALREAGAMFDMERALAMATAPDVTLPVIVVAAYDMELEAIDELPPVGSLDHAEASARDAGYRVYAGGCETTSAWDPERGKVHVVTVEPQCG